MRILHLTKKYPNATGGDATVVRQLELQQKHAGHDVYILTSNAPSIRTRRRVSVFGMRLSDNAIDQLSVRRVVSWLMLCIGSFRRLRTLRPDVIHSHSVDLGFWISPAAKWYKIPVINTCHGTSINKHHRSWFVRRLELFFLRHGNFNMILTVDSPSAEYFRSIGLHKTEYVPNAVSEPIKDAAAHPKKPKLSLLFVGRLERIKGIEYLLEALHGITDHDNIELVLAGDGSDAPHYKKLAEDLGLQSKVRFYGMVAPSKLPALYDAADIFVLPSLQEGFPIVMLEAWAAGMPVVMTNVGAVNTVCHDGVDALVVDPANSDQLRAAILRLAEDGALRKKLGENGRALVQAMYNYRVISAQIESLYRKATT